MQRSEGGGNLLKKVKTVHQQIRPRRMIHHAPGLSVEGPDTELSQGGAGGIINTGERCHRGLFHTVKENKWDLESSAELMRALGH